MPELADWQRCWWCSDEALLGKIWCETHDPHEEEDDGESRLVHGTALQTDTTDGERPASYNA